MCLTIVNLQHQKQYISPWRFGDKPFSFLSEIICMKNTGEVQKYQGKHYW